MSPTLAESYRLLIADVYELAGRSRATSEAISRRHGRTSAQGAVLSVLSDGERTAADVARRLGLSSTAVQRVIHDLIAAGQLSSGDNPADARAPLIRITAAGRRTWLAISADSDAVRKADLASTRLRRQDLDEARRTLQALLEALSPAGDQAQSD